MAFRRLSSFFWVVWISPLLVGLYYCWRLHDSDARRMWYSLLLVAALMYSLLMIARFLSCDRRYPRRDSPAQLRRIVRHGLVASLHFGVLLFAPYTIFVPIYFLNRGRTLSAMWLVQHCLLYPLYILFLMPSGLAAGLLYYFLLRRRENPMLPKE